MPDVAVAGLLILLLVAIGCIPLVREGYLAISTLTGESWTGTNTDPKNAEFRRGLIVRARQSIKIVSGNLNPAVYREVVSDISDALQRDQNIRVEVISGPTVYHDKEKETKNPVLALSGQYPARVLVRAAFKRPECHFMVINGSHLIIEDPHPELETHRTVHVTVGNVPLGRKYKEVFDQAWKALEKREPPED